MSSPKVLTWEEVPHAVAVAGNRDAMEHYLALARDVFEQTAALQREMVSMAGATAAFSAPAPVMDADAARTRAYQLFDASVAGYDAGMQGVEFAHAYWQSLKHNWQDGVVDAHSQARAAVDEAREQERERLQRAVSQVDASVRIEAAVNRVEIALDPGAVVHGWPERIEALLAGLRERVRDDDREALEQAIAASKGRAPEARWMALEALRLAQDQAAKARRGAAALALYRERQRTLRAERMALQAGRCAESLEGLASPRVDALREELAALEARLVDPALAEADEDRLEALGQQVLKERSRLQLLNDAVAQLRAMGYAQVQVMQTLTASDIASAFLEDPQDPERLALVQVSAQHGLMSVEVVRRGASDGSSAQRQADHGAQVRLCRALEKAEAALAERWKIAVRSDTPPGAPVSQARVALPKRRAAVHQAPAQRSRSVP